jgi:hypothetical protein
MADNVMTQTSANEYISNVPDQLKKYPHWIVYRLVQQGGRLMKIPRKWDELRRGEANAFRPGNQTTFENARAAACNAGPDYGVGIVLTSDAGLFVVDVDPRHSPEPETLLSNVEYLQGQYPTLSETSVSGEGRHLFYFGSLPAGWESRVDGIDVYDGSTSRFIAVTGNGMNPTGKIGDGRGFLADPRVGCVKAGASLTPVAMNEIQYPTADAVLQAAVARRSDLPQRLARIDPPDWSAVFVSVLKDLAATGCSWEGAWNVLRDAPLVAKSSPKDGVSRTQKAWRLISSPKPSGEWAKAWRATADDRATLGTLLTLRAQTLGAAPEGGEGASDAPAPPDATLTPDTFTHPDPYDFWGLLGVPEFPRDVVPSVIENFARQEAELMGCDPGGLAMAALSVAGTLISDRIKLRPKRHEDWEVLPRFWCALVGEPSTMKSPIIRKATRPIRALQGKLTERFVAELAAWEALPDDQQKNVDKPINISIQSDDTTIEGVQDVLIDNDDGMLLIKDELSGWFSFDKYSGASSNGAASADRAFWLQAYNGGRYALHRVKRGRHLIRNLSANVLGGIQPSVVRKIAANTGDDGLIQRFCVVMLTEAGDDKDVPVGSAYAAYRAAMENLHTVGGANVVGGSHEKAVLAFDDEAQRFRQECTSKFRQWARIGALGRKLTAHIGKYDGLFASLALIFHVLEHAAAPPSPEGQLDRFIPAYVGLGAAQRAMALIERYILPHSISFYGDLLGLSEEQEQLTKIASAILATGWSKVDARKIAQRISRAGLNAKTLPPLMDQLEAFRWVHSVENDKGRVAYWLVNEECHRRYQAQAQAERDRRAGEKERIDGLRKAAKKR